MLRITCPYCGIRDEDEFRFGGEVREPRPGLEVGDTAWADYLFNRNNIKGLQRERWCHADGCGQWFELNRNTLTHEFDPVHSNGIPRPEFKG